MSDMKNGDLKRNGGLGVSACVIGIAVFLFFIKMNKWKYGSSYINTQSILFVLSKRISIIYAGCVSLC